MNYCCTHNKGVLVQHQMIIAEMRARHVPVKVLCFEIQHKHVCKKYVQCTRYLRYGFGFDVRRRRKGCLLPIDELCSAGHQLSSGQAIPRFGVISRCPRNLPSLEEWLRL